MLNIKNKTFVLVYIGVVITAVFGCYLFIISWLEYYDSHRIYSVRKVPEEYRVSLVNKYIDNNFKDSKVLILGDSQPNGHLYPDIDIYSTRLENNIGKKVINLAFQDSRILDNIYILEYLIDKGYKVDNLIFNINQSHIKQNNFSRLSEVGVSKVEINLNIIKDINSFVKLILSPNPNKAPNENIRFSKYNNYFKIDDDDFDAYLLKLGKFIKLSKVVTNNTLIYITPHSRNAVVFNNRDDLKVLSEFSERVKLFCLNLDVSCVDIDIKEDEYYIDIVHFNSLGHKKMANLLASYIQ